MTSFNLNQLRKLQGQKATILLPSRKWMLKGKSIKKKHALLNQRVVELNVTLEKMQKELTELNPKIKNVYEKFHIFVD